MEGDFNMIDENDKIIIRNDHGEEKIFYQLVTFFSKETEKEYIIYTDNTVNNDNQLNIYGSILVSKDDSFEFIPVTDERDQAIIQDAIIQAKIELLNENDGGSN